MHGKINQRFLFFFGENFFEGVTVYGHGYFDSGFWVADGLICKHLIFEVGDIFFEGGNERLTQE